MTRTATTVDPIDRITPTLRPRGRTVMRHRWAKLLFLHWEVPVAALQPLIPPALEIDTFDGRAFVGLVPFTITGVRPVWLPPLPGLSSFHEVNVRTYVHHQGRDPGVWFFSLDAASRLAVAGARTFWGLPYHYARIALNEHGRRIEYASERVGPGPPARCRVVYEPTGSPGPATPGTLEHFLVERYILYTGRRGHLVTGRVHHAPYPLQGASVAEVDETLVAAAGIARPATPPLAHFAEEVRVRVYPLRVVDTA